MKRTTLFLASMLMVTVAFAYGAQGAKADNDGDYTPTTHVQWWWKFVRLNSQQKWAQIVQINSVAVEKGVVNARTQKESNAVVFTLVNKTAKPVECDGSVSIAHTIRGKDGSVIYMEELLPARLPKTLRPGETFRASVTASTPAKFRGEKQYLALSPR